jgi:hypothetical protein
LLAPVFVEAIGANLESNITCKYDLLVERSKVRSTRADSANASARSTSGTKARWLHLKSPSRVSLLFEHDPPVKPRRHAFAKPAAQLSPAQRSAHAQNSTQAW